MKNSTVIAICLFKASIVIRLEEGEHLVREMFAREFPTEDFHHWNREINDSTAQNLIQNVGKAMRIDVKQFIDDLRVIR